jgi:hypothetical protein
LGLGAHSTNTRFNSAARSFEEAHHPGDNLDGTFDLFCDDVMRAERHQSLPLEKVTRAHQYRRAGCYPTNGIHDPLRCLWIIHQQDDEPGAFRVRVFERLLAGRISVVNGKAFGASAPDVLRVQLEHDEGDAFIAQRAQRNGRPDRSR